MVERFDRARIKGGYLRLGLVSGLTLLDCDENYLDRERWSYPLLADELRRWSEKPDEDRVELFRRIVFNAAVTNKDDHPRNHAVRRTARGWRLTPAYDLVPAPVVSLERRDLAMTIAPTTAPQASITCFPSASASDLRPRRPRPKSRRWLQRCGPGGSISAPAAYPRRIPITSHRRFVPECFFFENPPEG